MCHPIALTGADVSFSLVDAPDPANAATPARCGVAIEVTCRCTGETGVEMEALTAAGVAAVAQDYISDIIDYLKRRITEKIPRQGPVFLVDISKSPMSFDAAEVASSQLLDDPSIERIYLTDGRKIEELKK